MKSLLTKKRIKELSIEFEKEQKTEDLRIKVLIKNFTPTKLEKVLKCLKKEDILDNESIFYKTTKGITIDEFNEVWDYLNNRYDPAFKDRTDLSKYYAFPEWRAFFQYKNTKFILRMIQGQGSIHQFLSLKAQDKKWPSRKFPMKFEEENKIIINFDKE